MNKSIRIVLKPALRIKAEQARDIRARALRYALDCYERHKAAKAQDGNVEAGSFAERHAHESGRANYRNGGGDF
jgi:hypothetical protein